MEISQASMSLSRLQRSLATVIDKHKVLRTCLAFDENELQLRQEILPSSLITMTFTTTDDEQHLHELFHNEETNAALFDLSDGRVFRCHIIRKSISSDNDLLTSGNILIFNFHHAAFDGSSIDIFFRDLQRAYTTDNTLEPCALDYIDYSVYEKQINMDEAKDFWKGHMDGFTNNLLQLPYDRIPRDNNTRSGHGLTVSFDLSQDIVDRILTYIVENDTTLFQFGLSVFYAYLFKLTQETDLCVLSVSANRPRPELQDIVGFFVNTLPHRLSIDPYFNFRRLIQRVKELVLTTLPYAHLHYQDIISNMGTNILQTMFLIEAEHDDVITLDSYTSLRPLAFMITDPQSIAKFDLTCSLYLQSRVRSITVRFNVSTDLFDMDTALLMANRLECLFSQLFLSSVSPIFQFSLLLSREIELLHQLNNGNKLCMSNPLPIHHRFGYQTQKHPQKVALILDDQCLTYAEQLSA